MKPASPRQLDALRFVAQQIRDVGYPPTIREIGTHVGIRSTNGVNEHLMALARKGLLALAPAYSMHSRGRVPTELGWQAAGINKPAAPPQRPQATSVPVVEVNLGWRCVECNAHTFDPTKPCFMCGRRKRGAA